MEARDLLRDGELVLEGTVLPSNYSEYFGSGIITPALVRDALAMLEGPVVAHVNSPGGYPMAGEAIRVMLEDHEGGVTVKIAGDAASTASLMVMGAERIEMSAGSVMMIHDPSTMTWGNAADHERATEMLNTIADTFAGVYALRAGITAEEARAIMRAETWFSPAAAVAAKFADAISGQEDDTETMEVPDDRRDAVRAQLEIAMTRLSSTPGNPAVAEGAAAGGVKQAGSATKRKEATMAKSTTLQQPTPGADTPAPPAPDTAMIADEAVKAERIRVKDIRAMAKPFIDSGQLNDADVDALIEDGTSSEKAATRMMSTIGSRAPVAQLPRGSATITRDETDTKMEGMIGALMKQTDGPAADFRGLRLKSLAMHLAGTRRTFNDHDAVRQGMMATTMMGGAHGVSDFAYVTTEVMNRTLLAEYDRRGSNWGLVTGDPISANDFREIHAVRFGGDFQLKTVKDNGEYQEATMSDEAEGLKVERRGRTINITFEAIVNDDMSAFARIPREFSIAARVMEASMVWSLIRTNAVLKSDAKALFHADHGNLAASGTAISVTSVGAARKAMWEQTAFGSKDADDFLQIEPRTLLVPPAKEVTAMQFVGATVPTKDADQNPYKSTLNAATVPHLGLAAGGSDTAWYLVSPDLPPIAVAYLDGYQAPSVQTMEGMNPDLVKMNARHIFGAAPSEFRGIWKNPGA